MLTVRERAILQGLAAGLTQRELARRLGVSERTVRSVIAELQEKLDATTPFTLGLNAARRGLVP